MSIERLRELSEKASPGRWGICSYKDSHNNQQRYLIILGPDDKEIFMVSEDFRYQEDAEFIVELVNYFRATGNIAGDSLVESTVGFLLVQREKLLDRLLQFETVDEVFDGYREEIANIDCQIRGLLGKDK